MVPILLLDDDARDVGGSEDKIRMIDSILFAIGHVNGERLEWRRFEEQFDLGSLHEISRRMCNHPRH